MLTNFLKKEDKQPLNTPVLEMRKSSNKTFWYVVGLLVCIGLLILLFVK